MVHRNCFLILEAKILICEKIPLRYPKAFRVSIAHKNFSSLEAVWKFGCCQRPEISDGNTSQKVNTFLFVKKNYNTYKRKHVVISDSWFVTKIVIDQIIADPNRPNHLYSPLRIWDVKNHLIVFTTEIWRERFEYSRFE